MKDDASEAEVGGRLEAEADERPPEGPGAQKPKPKPKAETESRNRKPKPKAETEAEVVAKDLAFLVGRIRRIFSV